MRSQSPAAHDTLEHKHNNPPRRMKTLIAGNWKMHLNTHQASLLLHRLNQTLEAHHNVEAVVFPNTLVLQSLSLQVDHHKLALGAQNCYWRDEGAYTGEVSATMLRGLVRYVLVGHSERRHIFGESDVEVRNKVQAVIRNGMQPILCVGETAQQKADGETKHVLHDQIVAGLANITSHEVHDLTIAYEPVWAISNGTDFAHHAVATPMEATAAAQEIRHQIRALYGADAAQNVRILYGGSSDADNADGFLRAEGIDGLLIGGDSLNARHFCAIVAVAHQIQAEKHKGMDV